MDNLPNIPIKFKIIKVWPHLKQVDVHYYTDELLAAVQPTWERERALLRNNFEPMPQEQEDEVLVRRFPGGTVTSVSLYEYHIGQPLIDYLVEKAPYTHIMHLQECLLNPEDSLMNVNPHIGVEYEGTPVMYTPDGQSATPGTTPIPTSRL